jgi:hypothetical protein
MGTSRVSPIAFQVCRFLYRRMSRNLMSKTGKLNGVDPLVCYKLYLKEKIH